MTPILSPDRIRTLWYRMSHQAFRLAWKVFRPTTVGVKVIMADTDGRILLVKPHYLEAWTLPGGGVNKRETPEQAAARELAEETRLVIEPARMRLMGLLSNFTEGKSDYVAVYSCEMASGTTPIAQSEIEQAAFFTPWGLPANTSPATRRRLDEYFARESMQGNW